MSANRAALFWLRVTCLAGLLSFATADASDAPAASVTPLIQQMAGTWKVQSRMWPAPGAKAVDLPPAVARREVVAGAYLQEVMEPAEGIEQPPFKRVAYFSYNPVNQQYEYFSLDSRLPQMMSYVTPGANKTREGRVELAGASFVAPEWGTKKSVPFMYRLTVRPVEGDRQVVHLFLTEQAPGSDEFLAFEYVYSRQP